MRRPHSFLAIALVSSTIAGCAVDQSDVAVERSVDSTDHRVPGMGWPAARQGDGPGREPASSPPGCTPIQRSLAIGFTNDNRLVTFDPVAGTIEEVHLQMGRDGIVALAHDPGHNRLIALSVPFLHLYSIDLATMSTTHSGNLLIERNTSQMAAGGLAADPVDDTLYGTIVRWEEVGDIISQRTDLVEIEVATAAVTTLGTIPGLAVWSLTFHADERQLYGLGRRDEKYYIVRIDPTDASAEEVFLSPYDVMVGLAWKPATNKYLTWINDETHHYAEIDLDTQTITALGNSDGVQVISAFVQRNFDAATVPVPRAEIPASFRIRGHVLNVRDPDDLLDGSIRTGDRFSGRLTYDVNAPYRRAAFQGSYEISVSIRGRDFSVLAPAATVQNNLFLGTPGSLFDTIQLTANRCHENSDPSFPVPMPCEQARWSLVDSSAATLSNDDTLPVSYDLSDWDMNRLDIRGATEDTFDDGYHIQGTVDSIRPD